MVFETRPVLMNHKIPDTVERIAWNGAYLFYIAERQNRELHKCAGNIKRADFGKLLLSKSWNFSVTESEDPRYNPNVNIKIAANNTHVFCLDEKELLVFDIDLVLQSRLEVLNAPRL